MAFQLARDASTEPKLLTYKDIASSKPFRFTVGPEKREFTIHSALVAAQSPALDRLVNSDFKESRDYHVELETVDEETFIRFVQYAYTGNYGEDDMDVVADNEPDSADSMHEAMPCTAPAPESADLTPEAVLEAEVDGEQDTLVNEMWSVQTKPRKKEIIKVLVFRELSRKLTRKISEEAEKDAVEGVVLKGNPTANPFLTHARVFVFADYWGVTRLKDVSLRSLGKALEGAAVKKRVTRDRIVDLLEYCYTETRPDEIMTLVTLFAACKLPHLWVSERFREIFGANKEMSVSVIGAMIYEAGM